MPKNQKNISLTAPLEPYWDDGTDGWLRFMRDELLYKPDACMLPIIDDIANYRDTAVRSCHGVGKTTVGANIMLTSLCLIPELFVFQISPTWSQVKGTFWNEVRKWYRNSEIARAMFEMAE